MNFIGQNILNRQTIGKQKQQTEHKDCNQISFDGLIEKSQQSHSPSFDNIFTHIQLVQQKQKSIKSLQIPQKINSSRAKDRNKENALTFTTVQQINEMLQSSKLRMMNKKLEQQLSKVKDKYKKSLQGAQNNDKQEALWLKKQNQAIKNKIIAYQQQMQMDRLKQNKIHQQLKIKYKKLEAELKIMKEQKQKNEKSKSEVKNKLQVHLKKIQQYEQTIGQLDKKLRVKEKQLTKMQQLQNQRNVYYQSIFNQKQSEIQKLRLSLKKKGEQFVQATSVSAQQFKKIVHQLSQIKKQNNEVQMKFQIKDKNLQKLSSTICQAIALLSQNIEQQNEIKSNYSTRSKIFSISSQFKSLSKGEIDEGCHKKLLELVMQIIQKNRSIINQKNFEIQNYRSKYQSELVDLDHKMGRLAEQNRHLKCQKENLKIQNIQLNNSFSQALHKDSIQQQIKYKEFKNLQKQEQKFRQKLQEVRKQRHLSQKEFKIFMNTERILYPKIKQQFIDSQTLKVKQEIEKARLIFNEVNLRNNSTRKQGRSQSQTSLHRRSRQSLSWKKPSNILKQYI